MRGQVGGSKSRRIAVGVLARTMALTAGGGWGQEREQSNPNVPTGSQAAFETALVLGPGKNLLDARKCFERDARRGYAPAQVNLAVFYIKGWGGLEQNYGTALYWLREAAKQGQSRAYTNLGILYLNGWGVARNNEEALRNFRFAAEWYRRAAERGDALGQNNLADAYLRGIGVKQSDARAAEWFTKAAEQGQTAARIKLGFLYMTGRGVGKNPVTAYGWILAASLAGDHRGEEYLGALQREMQAEQLEAATKRAHELQALHYPLATETALVR